MPTYTPRVIAYVPSDPSHLRVSTRLSSAEKVAEGVSVDAPPVAATAMLAVSNPNETPQTKNFNRFI